MQHRPVQGRIGVDRALVAGVHIGAAIDEQIESLCLAKGGGQAPEGMCSKALRSLITRIRTGRSDRAVVEPTLSGTLSGTLAGVAPGGGGRGSSR